jgi:hypothetical protein
VKGSREGVLRRGLVKGSCEGGLAKGSCEGVLRRGLAKGSCKGHKGIMFIQFLFDYRTKIIFCWFSHNLVWS